MMVRGIMPFDALNSGEWNVIIYINLPSFHVFSSELSTFFLIRSRKFRDFQMRSHEIRWSIPSFDHFFNSKENVFSSSCLMTVSQWQNTHLSIKTLIFVWTSTLIFSSSSQWENTCCLSRTAVQSTRCGPGESWNMTSWTITMWWRNPPYTND